MTALGSKLARVLVPRTTVHPQVLQHFQVPTTRCCGAGLLEREGVRGDEGEGGGVATRGQHRTEPGDGPHVTRKTVIFDVDGRRGGAKRLRRGVRTTTLVRRSDVRA